MVLPAAISDLPESGVAPATLPTGVWWKRFFEASEDALVVCRADGILVQINPRAARQLALNRQRDEGSFSIFDTIAPPADRKLADVLRRPRLHSDTFHSVVVRIHDADRGLMDLEITPLSDGHTLVSFKDAARRLRLESHVSRLVTAIDATPDAFFITDAENRITYVNPAFHAMSGFGIETVLGRTDEFLRAPSEQDKVREYHEKLGQGREWIGELVNVRSDGDSYQVEATLSPICDITGQYIGYVACERDITARKQLEQDVRLQRDFVRSILHSLEGAIYSLDREFHITHANEGWRRLPSEHGGIQLEGPPEIGRPLLAYVPNEARRQELAAVFLEVLTTGHRHESQYHASDDRHWQVNISPWIHEGEVRGLICAVTDQSRYHELQGQLFQAQKMEIIGTLAAGVAHDFNNLLQAIRGNSSLVILQTTEESDLRHWAEQINLAAARAAEITQQLLTFSRESDDRRRVLDLNHVIHEASQLARRTLRNNVTIVLEPAAEPVPVKIDHSRANQALLNLCVNAQDAMPDGGTLTLTNTFTTVSAEIAEWYNLKAGAKFACCSVRDTGAGIAPGVLPRIFDAFYTTKEKGKGTGLGLSIVKRVMQEAGGFVDVHSEAGKGACFQLYFPVAEEPVTQNRQMNCQAPARLTGRVLVVDDMDLLRDFAKSFLETAGMTVLVAHDGPQALQLLEHERGTVDILFTDFNMPGMNGIELIEQVTTRWPHVKPMLASGYLDKKTRSMLNALNVRMLAKPYEMQEAADAIVSLLPASKGA